MVEAWLADPVLCNRAANWGKIIDCPGKVTRSHVIGNYETLLPILKSCGPRLNVGFVQESVRTFLWKARPRGMPQVSGALRSSCKALHITSCFMVQGISYARALYP